MRAPIQALTGWNGQNYYPGQIVCNKGAVDAEAGKCKAHFVGQDHVKVECSRTISAKEKHVINVYDIKPWSKSMGQSAQTQEGAEMHCLKCNAVVGNRKGCKIHFFRHSVAEQVHQRGRSLFL